MTHPRTFGFGQLFKAMVEDIKRNRQIFILLVLLWTVLSTLLIAPLLEDIALLQKMAQGDPERLAQALGVHGPKLFTYSIINMMVLMILPMLWSRLLLHGGNAVLGPDLLPRYGLVLFRTISLIGYQLLAILFIAVISVMVQAVGGVIGLNSSLQAMIPILFSLMVFVPVYLAFTLSIVGTSIGHKGFGIFQALKEMRHFFGPWLSMAALIVLAFTIISGLLITPFLGADGNPTRMSTILGGLANGFMLILLFTAAIAVYRHYLLPKGDTPDA